MNILLSTDNGYVMPTGVLMHSISINNKDVHYYILVNETFSTQNRNSLSQIAKKYGNRISFFVVTNDMTQMLPFGKGNQPKHVSIATYYRLFISEILPTDVHKILYLDGDMIVRKSIRNLWNSNIEDHALCVVHDADEKKHQGHYRLPYPMEKGYFNAGMLLINVDYWRKHDCFQQFMKFVDTYKDKILLHDQDVLNAVLYNSVKWVPMTYNFQTNYVMIPSYYEYDEKYEEEANRTMYNPSIIHFTSSDKPWKINCYHPHTAVWRYYWQKSEWKTMKLQGENPHSIKDSIRFFALRHNLYMPKYIYKRCILKK